MVSLPSNQNSILTSWLDGDFLKLPSGDVAAWIGRSGMVILQNTGMEDWMHVSLLVWKL